jgi:hypothetical protein
MILYELKCPSEHFFEGWFRNSDGYEEQRAAGEIACPACGSAEIEKAMMAPRLGRSEKTLPAMPEKAAKLPTPMEQLQLLRGLRKAIETGCENVGDRFAEEARKIHYDEAPARGIRGIASAEQTRELIEEGIDVLALPIPAALEGPLQ